MNLRHLLEWCQLDTVFLDTELKPQRAVLPGFRFRTNYVSSAGGGAANIEQSKGSCVEGVVLSIPIPMLHLIRRKEGFPFRYREVLVRVKDETTGQCHLALTYQVAPRHRRDLDVQVCESYRNTILVGAMSHRLSREYQKMLRSIRTKAKAPVVALHGGHSLMLKNCSC